MAKQLQNQVLLDYHGLGAPVPFRGPVTKTNYEFGGAVQQAYVDERDVTGMLQMKWVRGNYFTVAEIPEVPAEEPETPEEPVDDGDPEDGDPEDDIDESYELDDLDDVVEAEAEAEADESELTPGQRAARTRARNAAAKEAKAAKAK